MRESVRSDAVLLLACRHITLNVNMVKIDDIGTC